MPEARNSTLRAFGIAVAAVVGATLVRFLLTPLVGPHSIPFATYFLAVVVVALAGYLSAALFATGLSAAAGAFFFLSSGADTLTGVSSGQLSLVVFLFTCGIIAALTARLERAQRDATSRAELAADHNVALERERANLQRETRRLALLADVSDVGTPNPTFAEVARHATKRVAEEIGDGSVIRIFEEGGLVVAASHHVAEGARPWMEAVLLQPQEALHHKFYRQLRETRRTIVLDNPRSPDVRPLAPQGFAAEHDKYEARHAAVSPLLHGDALLGAMTVFRAEDRPYSETEIVALDAVASRVAIALDNARLMETAKRDAEEARSARMAAEDASRVKDEFLATLSHELRTPLNAIVGWAHMLRDPRLPDDRRRAAIETILRNAQSQEQLIADILEVQRIMAGKLRLELRSVDLGSIVRAAAETVQPSADAKGIKLQLLLDLNVTPIWGDPDRLQQIIWNLLSNAIKFTPTNGRVQVRVLQNDSDCELVVEDNGPGIAQEFLPYVFERFRQADSSSTRTHKGLGLGLAIVRNLVEMHGGTIEAVNVDASDRTGAVFAIRFPRHAGARMPAVRGVDLEGTAAGLPEWLGEGPSLAGILVLVVDDDGDARELVSTILTRYDAEVITCGSVAEGMQALRKSPPHVVVTDIEMPDEDGYAFIRLIRALPPDAGGRIPAAALTAYAGSSDRMKVLAAGFNMHVAKPVQPAELAMVVASLARPHLEQLEKSFAEPSGSH